MNNDADLPLISIVIPLFNEEKVFDLLIERLMKLVDNSNLSFEILLIDDGSSDSTSVLMRNLAMNNSLFNCIFLSRNYGHQIALTAGLLHARGTEAIFIIDGDLQDPPELFFEFHEKLKSGYDVVYAIRQNRKEGFLLRFFYSLFYRILDRISDIKIPLDSGDFGIMSRRVVDVLNDFPEHSRYIRGLRAWVGFNQVGILYDRDSRKLGESKYSFRLLLRLAKEGVYNFSEFPIVFITRLGFFSFFASFFYLIHVFVKKFVYNVVPEGFTALLFFVIMFSGIILISLGVLGEYILRIFRESTNRPLFIVKEQIVNGDKA